MGKENGKLRVRLVPSATGDDGEKQYSTSFLLNDTIAINAGSVGYFGPTDRQMRIRHVLITHSHSDHTASLPVLLENAYTPDEHCIEVLGSTDVLDCLERDVFNNRVWPSLEVLTSPGRPYVRFTTLESEKMVEIDGLRVTPVDVDHTVPTFGYIVESEGAAVVFSGDTGPTRRIWEIAGDTPNLAAVFLEVTFPNSMHELARVSGHLTPEMAGREAEKFGRDSNIIAFHLKPRFREEVIKDLESLGLPNLVVGSPFKEYCW